MWLLIDDVRDLNCDVIARNGRAALHLLNAHKWECVVFDHDLGIGLDGRSINGYEVMMHAFLNGSLTGTPRIQLCTSNPVGRDNMIAVLLYNGYVGVNGSKTDFVLKETV